MQAIAQHNLPTQTTSFIGRQDDIAAVCSQLRDDNCRLLTLVGPGGTGKTRLSLQIGHRLLNDYLHGVTFVDLTPITDAANIPATIAEALGMFGVEKDPLDALTFYLYDQDKLMILDNYEHLLDGVGYVRALLEKTPVTILVTSRESLRLNAEWRYDLRGLPIPEDIAPDGPEQGDAVSLFAERARHVRASFDLDQHRDDVLKLCHMVDGMPLALELAAAWMEALPPETLVEELSHSLDVLSSDRRDADPRHSSVRAVLRQSWNRLSEHEQGIMAALTVFHAPVTLDAARKVAGASMIDLRNLVARSMLRVNDDGRYTLHMLTHQYAAEHVTDSDALSDRHCAYFCMVQHDLAPALKGHRVVEAMNDFGVVIEDILVAWEWAIEHEQWQLIGQAVEAFGLFYNGSLLHGVRARDLLHAAIERCSEPFVKALLLIWRSRFGGGMDDPTHINYSAAAITLLRDLDAPCWLALALGLNAHQVGNLGAGLDWDRMREAVDRVKQHCDPYYYAMLLRLYATFYYHDRDFESSTRINLEALDIARQMGHLGLQLTALYNQANIEQTFGNLEGAYQYRLEQANLSQDTLFLFDRQVALLKLAAILSQRGEYERALEYALESVQLSRQIGVPRMVYRTANQAGWAHFRAGRYEEALPLAQQALAAAQQYNDPGDQAPAYNLLGALYRHLDQPTLAQQHYLRGLAMGEQANRANLITMSLTSLNYDRVLDEEFEQAAEYGRRAYEVASEASLGLPLRIGVHGNYAHALVFIDRVTEARPMYRKALQLAWEAEFLPNTLESLLGVARLVVMDGDIERGLQLFGLVSSKPEVSGDVRKLIDVMMKDLRAELPAAYIQQHIAAGTDLDLEEVVTWALDYLSDDTQTPIAARSATPSPLIDPLTERETEVLSLVARGMSNRQIAAELFLALGTVKTHIHNIYGKLGVENRTQAVIKAQELGLV